MDIVFHTNLDEAQRYLPGGTQTEEFPVPAVGARLRLKKSEAFSFDLEVVAVVYDLSRHRPVMRVELHIPKHFQSIRSWSDWFKDR